MGEENDTQNSNLILYDLVECNSLSNSNLQLDPDLLLLQNLLEEWNLLSILPLLQSAGITYRSLKYLSKDDIKEIIGNVGLRAEFREKLFHWRKDEHDIDDDTITNSTKVSTWLDENIPKTPTCSTVKVNLSKHLSELLKECHKGNAILEYYKTHSYLDKLRRDDLISIILEDIHYNDKHLAPKDYPPILQEIEGLFPTEKDFLDYYYFARNKRRNPGGKLYNKVVNTLTKIRKTGVASPSTSSSIEKSITYEEQEFDEEISISLKTSLAREISNWGEVTDKWEKTFFLRRKEIKADESKDLRNVLIAWPLYKNANAKELINIDFRLMFPNKEHLLYSKWTEFKKKVKQYYSKNINDKACNQLFSSLTESTETNAEDYILCILLNAVILPTGRFKDTSKGSNKRKVTIKDAQESFTLRISTINDLDRSVTDLQAKYYSNKLTLQPFIIVVGLSFDQITDYYVYFDKCLQKHDSYLSCVDSCFKLFNVLSLEYQQASVGAWLFIQKYFFQIETKFDQRLPAVSSLIAYLNIN